MDNNGTPMYMPVAPAGYGSGFGGGFGGDGWWIILLLLFAGGGMWGNGFGGFGGGEIYPWMNQADITTSGFQNQMLQSGISGLQGAVTGGFGDVQTALCGGFASVNGAIANGFAQAEIANNARQMADMSRSFDSQVTTMQGFNGLQSQLAQCCCDNRLAIANLTSVVQAENCADRAAMSDGLRDIIVNQTANTQKILDTMCQDKIDAKNEKILELQNSLNMANLAASQVSQTAQIIAAMTPAVAVAA